MIRGLIGWILLLVWTGMVSAEESTEPVDDRARFTQVIYLLNNGVYFEAIRQLETFIENTPDHEAAHLRLAEALHHVRRDVRAAQEAATVLRINPKNRKAKRLLTQLRIKLGRELDTSQAESVLDYARLCAYTDSYGRASAFYGRYLEQRPSDHEVRLELAKLLTWSQQYDRARTHYQVYVNARPDDLEARHAYGRILNAAGQFGEAIELLEACLEEMPGRDDIRIDLARACLWAGAHSKYQPIFRYVVKMETEAKEDLLFLADLAGHFRWIEDEYRLNKKILEVAPDYQPAFDRVAEMDRRQSVQTQLLRRKLVEDPDNMKLRRDLIEHFITQQQLGKALTELDRMPDSDPIRSELSVQIEHMREQTGARAVAQLAQMQEIIQARDVSTINTCKDWLKTYPEDARTRGLLAFTLNSEKQFEAAASEYRILLKTFPTVHPAIAERLEHLEQGASVDD